MTTPELIKWLRDNSSGIYRSSAEAANLIEDLLKENALIKNEMNMQKQKYNELASHHNKHCTCNEIY